MPVIQFVLAAYSNYSYVAPPPDAEHTVLHLLHRFMNFQPTPASEMPVDEKEAGREAAAPTRAQSKPTLGKTLPPILSALTDLQALLIVDISKGFDTVLKSQAKGHDEAMTYLKVLSALIRMSRYGRIGHDCFDGLYFCFLVRRWFVSYLVCVFARQTLMILTFPLAVNSRMSSEWYAYCSFPS